MNALRLRVMAQVDRTFQHKRALQLWKEGCSLHSDGKLDQAMKSYDRSIGVCPTAEAHTFKGWVFSNMKKYSKAIAECKTAVSIDPKYGNAYNDIGSYLIHLGKLDEAERWLVLAKRAPRYDQRHYPYMNMGRVYAARGQVWRAIHEFEQALSIAPSDAVCRAALAELRALIS